MIRQSSSTSIRKGHAAGAVVCAMTRGEDQNFAPSVPAYRTLWLGTEKRKGWPTR